MENLEAFPKIAGVLSEFDKNSAKCIVGDPLVNSVKEEEIVIAMKHICKRTPCFHTLKIGHSFPDYFMLKLHEMSSKQSNPIYFSFD